MYEAFYGLREKPFSIIPDPSFLFSSRQHAMALMLVEYGLMNQAGFNVITGEIGTGKTTLMRHLLNRVPDTMQVGLISNTHRDFGELMQWLLYAFGLPYKDKGKVEMHETFIDFLTQAYGKRQRVLLIVDEAQNMNADSLEQLRMLSNINADKDQLLQIILVGQPQLRQLLSQPELEQFAQRIAVDFHLVGLEEDETIAYIRHRLAHAGSTDEIFDHGACSAVHQFSGGVPRVINLICDTALVYGYAESARRVGVPLIAVVINDKLRGGLFKRSIVADQMTKYPSMDSKKSRNF